MGIGGTTPIQKLKKVKQQKFYSSPPLEMWGITYPIIITALALKRSVSYLFRRGF